MSGPFSVDARRAFQQQSHSHAEFGHSSLTASVHGIADTSVLLDTGETWLGAWSSYTPTLAQGTSTNIAKTVTYAKYVQIGKTVIGQVMVAATGTGTAGSKVTLSLPPVTAASSSGPPIGAGIVLDNGTAWYPAVVWLSSTTTMALLRADASGGNKEGFGFDPNVAVAAGDQFNAQFMYEAA